MSKVVLDRENVLAQLRKRGLSQADAARRAGIPQQTFSKALLGRPCWPATAAAIARMIHSTPIIDGLDELLGSVG